MTYTLFVDESGCFNVTRARWVVSGVLVPGNPRSAEAAVRNVLAPTLKADIERIGSAAELHLTEVRGGGGDRARRLARVVLDALCNIRGVSVGAVRNRRGRIAGGRSGPINTYERSYRLMLLDLVALLESSIHEPVTRLHMVVATRTYRGDRMSRLSEIGEDVLGQLAEAVEAGLAARGLLEAAGSERLHHEYASKRWGLAAADVVANVAYHEPDGNGEDAKLIGEYEKHLGYRVFEAFGEYEIRRARVAERDGDLPLALSRWASFEPGNRSADRRERSQALLRLVERALCLRDPYGPRATIEAALERIRTNTPDPHKMGKALRALESTLEQVDLGDSDIRQRLLFRTRSFARDFAHRRADLGEAKRIDREQMSNRAAIAASPKGFPLVLDDDIRAINLRTQKLDLESALETARSYFKLVEHYGVVWELVGGVGEADAFKQGRTLLRATQALARHLAFAAPLQAPHVEEEFLDEAKLLLEALPNPGAPDDQSRLQNDKVLVALRRGDTEQALALADLGGDSSAYDYYYACRAATHAILSDPEKYQIRAEEIYSQTVSADHLFEPLRNPLQLAWRERALLAHALGYDEAARLALSAARSRTNKLNNDAPIKGWLTWVLDVYASHINRKPGPPTTPNLKPGAKRLCEATIMRARSSSLLTAVQSITPY